MADEWVLYVKSVAPARAVWEAGCIFIYTSKTGTAFAVPVLKWLLGRRLDPWDRVQGFDGGVKPWRIVLGSGFKCILLGIFLVPLHGLRLPK